MSVFIPCLNVDKPDSGGGFSVGVGVGASSAENPTAALGVSVSHSDSPIAVTIAPVPPFIFFGPNFRFWSDLFGLGETRIEREKETIQDVLTSIFRYLKNSYGVPIRDGHALQFPSDGVQAQFSRRPDIAALAPALMATSDIVTSLVFASKDTSQGQKERVVNQFLANAAINDWPVSSTLQIWEGMVAGAHPDCSSDPGRWLKNPAIVATAAELAVTLQYIPLYALGFMATAHAIGDPLAERLILAWVENPDLVKDIPYRQQYPWQSIYERGEWALPPYRLPWGGAVPLYQRDHFKQLQQQVLVLRPTYPDFIDPPPGGIQGRPPGQTTPPPPPVQPPAPPPEQPPPPPPGEQPPPTQPPQGPTVPPVDQPPIVPPVNQTNVIPTQADYDLGCQISRKFAQNLPLTQAELDWMLTVAGAKAVTWAVNTPGCGRPNTQAPTVPPDDPLQQCPQPQFPQFPQLPPGGQFPPPGTTPQPFPPPTQQDGHCDPDCQVQIDQLGERLDECCDTQTYWVIPNIQNLWTWLLNLEQRVPGPPPPLAPTPPASPEPTPQPLPGPLPEPPDENPPGEPPPVLPPEVVECLEKLCDPAQFCQKVQECERELECVRIPLCDPQGGPWGGMAECWHDKNRTPDRDVYGVYRQAQLPSSFVNVYLRSYEQAFGIQGQQSGQGSFVGYDLRNPGRFDAVADRLAQSIVDDWIAGTISNQRESVTIPSRPWIFADPAEPGLGQVKIRQPKLRPGETDPCSVEPGQVLELP